MNERDEDLNERDEDFNERDENFNERLCLRRPNIAIVVQSIQMTYA